MHARFYNAPVYLQRQRPAGGGGGSSSKSDDRKPSTVPREEVGNTPLHYAAFAARGKGLAKLLIGCGAKIDAVNRRGCTPLHTAAEQNRSHLVAFILQSAPKAAGTTASKLLSLADKSGETALHKAGRLGSAECCRALLSHPAVAQMDVADFNSTLNAASKGKGDTALILASCWGHRAVSSLLEHEYGADPEPTTRNGWNAARWAAWWDENHGTANVHDVCAPEHDGGSSDGAGEAEVGGGVKGGGGAAPAERKKPRTT